MNKTQILFVCLGNICRSPAAEGVFKNLLIKSHLKDIVEVDSAGTSGYHAGELADKRMRSAAHARKIDLTSRSRKFETQDFKKFDYIVVMDDSNYHDVMALDYQSQYEHKVVKMTDFCDGEFSQFDYVPDPYYDGQEGFELVLNLLENACANFLIFLEKGHK